MSRTLLSFAAFALAFAAPSAALAKFETDYQGGPLPGIGTLNVTIDEDLVGEDSFYAASRSRFGNEPPLIDPADASQLVDDLREDLEAALSRSGAYTPALAQPLGVLNVTITDVRSSNPGFTRNGFRNFISASSTGRGGARIEAELLQPDGGQAATFSFHWDETNIDLTQLRSPWWGANRAFSRFARQLANEID